MPVLLSLPATASSRAAGPVLQRRTLVFPSRPAQVPPPELYVAAGVATLVLFETPPRPEAQVLVREEGRIHLGRMEDGSVLLVPTEDLVPGERVLFSVATPAGAEPLRFVLVTRRDAVDVRVRVVRAQPSADEDGAELVARSLLDAPDARATLAFPQEGVQYESGESRGRVDSVLWVGRRFFIAVSVRGRKKDVPPWRLVQARLRVTLPDGVLLEWPARLVTGAADPWLERHIVTGLLPEGGSEVELALDGEDAPGPFRPLVRDEEPSRP
ncbi:hypothetical protein Q664_44655 [Archangium violaceum Cb vi76]|uniref:Uncharacterized protein n=1 Tax=Archangium violaceum Cb vi76 TaxID=1406225 RepID=A0A084SHE4_9BACT|nr:hypothetical protein Q664_44655 [Archangium violaceum Cb vi76]